MNPGIIQQFENRLEEIRKQEMARYGKKLNSREHELIESVSKRIMQKITSVPVLPLSIADKRGNGDDVKGTLKTLFDLDRLMKLKENTRSRKNLHTPL